VLFQAQKILKFGAPLMVMVVGWEREKVSMAAVISNFIAIF
jgi:hypothetical protein